MDIQTQENLPRLRAMLHDLRSDLRGELAGAGRPASRDAADTADLKDLARDQSDSRVEEFREQRELSNLDAVEAALRRMDADAYGDCCECGEPIRLARLLTLPTATRCAACQQRAEHELQFGRKPAPGAAPVRND